MKLKTGLFTALLMIAGLTKSTAQHSTNDSLRIRIEEDKNGNMFVIDTAVAASQHDQLMQWITSQGIELPKEPAIPAGDSSQKVMVEIETIDDTSDSGMKIIQPPLPPNAPLPPPAPGQKIKIVDLPPLPPGTDGQNMRVVIINDSTGSKHQCTKTVTVVQTSQAPATPENAKVKTVVKNAPDPNALKVFPNPSSGHFTININMAGKEKADLRITDMNGKTVYAEQLGTETENLSKEIDLSKNGKGIYNVEVHKGDKVIVEKISVE